MRNVLITGAAGYIGSQLVQTLRARPEIGTIVSVDVRAVTETDRIAAVFYEQCDVRAPALSNLMSTSAAGYERHDANLIPMTAEL